MTSVMNTPKRKAESTSSISELDSSKNSHSTPVLKNKSKKEKRALKKRRRSDTRNINKEDLELSDENQPIDEETETDDEEDDYDDDDYVPLSIVKQLSEINQKLSNVITKSDTSLLKSLIKDTLLEMKEQITSSLTRKVEILEGEVHEMSVENAKLKTEVDRLNKKIEKKDEDQHKIEQKIEAEENKRVEIANEQEQYSRRNNIRIMSLPGDHPKETADETTMKTLDLFKNKLQIDIQPRDIDIAHRLGKHIEGKSRQVIVKFVNRNTKYRIMSSKKMLKGTKISIFEDLTRMNNEVLASARKKWPSEVEQSWSKEGKLFVKWKGNAKIERIEFKDYKYWLEMPWPKNTPIPR